MAWMKRAMVAWLALSVLILLSMSLYFVSNMPHSSTNKREITLSPPFKDVPVPTQTIAVVTTHDADAIAFQEMLLKQQFPEDRANRRTVKFSFGGEGWPVGLGWVLEHMIVAMTYAISTNRTLVIYPDDAWYLARDACPEKSYLCFLEAITNLQRNHVNEVGMPMTQQCSGMERHVAFDHYPKDTTKFAACPTCVFMEPDNEMMPWRFKRHGKVWLQGQIMRFLFRPKPWMLDIAQAQMDSWVRPMIGMHIRRGDKVKGPHREARKVEMEDYVKKAYLLKEQYNVSHIFVSTDDPAELEQDKLAQWEGLTFHYDASEYRVEDGSGLRMMEKREFNRTAEGIGAVKNIYLLGSCDFFIGTISSFFGRQGMRLQFGVDRPIAWYSLDKDPWDNFPYRGVP